MTDIPKGNYLIDCELPHGEVLEISSRNIWQSVNPITREEFAALSLPDGFVRVGIGSGIMDAHYFRQSPGAVQPGPVRERVIGNLRFIHCANPPAAGADTPIANGPKRLMVNKHHTLIFEPGRELPIIRTPEGCDYVQVIAATPEGGGLLQKESDETSANAAELSLPTDWQPRTERVTARTYIHLPNPTEAWFFPDGSSFQGPIFDFNPPRSAPKS